MYASVVLVPTATPPGRSCSSARPTLSVDARPGEPDREPRKGPGQPRRRGRGSGVHERPGDGVARRALVVGRVERLDVVLVGRVPDQGVVGEARHRRGHRGRAAARRGRRRSSSHRRCRWPPSRSVPRSGWWRPPSGRPGRSAPSGRGWSRWPDRPGRWRSRPRRPRPPGSCRRRRRRALRRAGSWVAPSTVASSEPLR